MKVFAILGAIIIGGMLFLSLVNKPVPAPVRQPSQAIILPTVTPTPDPTLTYKRTALNHIHNLAEGMQNLGKVLKEARLGDEDWKTQVIMWASQIQDAHKFMSEVEAPAELADLHQQITNATRACSAAADATIVYVGKPNDDMLLAGMALLADCNDLLPSAVDAIGAK